MSDQKKACFQMSNIAKNLSAGGNNRIKWKKIMMWMSKR